MNELTFMNLFFFGKLKLGSKYSRHSLRSAGCDLELLAVDASIGQVLVFCFRSD